ncbi:MAG: type II toxin-antitoxin system HipA family toxin [Myxococcales bacterium]|nr:type II toxin-antitoxin system HipA family toxin [Myxococcales bacterium]
MTVNDVLHVSMFGTPVGQLRRRHPDGPFVFVDDPLWIRHGMTPLFSLQYQTTHKLKKSSLSNLPRWFEHLLPPQHGFLRRLLQVKTGVNNVAGHWLLSLVGSDLPGAVVVSGTVEPSHEIPIPSPDPTFRFSLAGMQLKFSVDAVGERFAIPGRGAFGRWIVKIPGDSFLDLPEVELTTMEWARRSGLRVPECRVVPVDHIDGLGTTIVQQSPTVYAVRRFDRTDSGGRIHQEDFAQVLDIDADEESIYGRIGTNYLSYDSALMMVHDVVGDAAAVELARRIAFVIVSGNGDAHLKNWGFYWPDPNTHIPHLSPCYDQVATIVWERFGWDQPDGPELALRLSKSKRFVDIDTARIRHLLRRVNVPGLEDAFYETLFAAKNTWPMLEPRPPKPMVAAIEQHFANVPLLRHVGSPPD